MSRVRVLQNGLVGNYKVMRDGSTWKTGLTARGVCQLVSDRDLFRLSIRVNCENELNRQADLELKRRGYVFNLTEQRWTRNKT